MLFQLLCYTGGIGVDFNILTVAALLFDIYVVVCCIMFCPPPEKIHKIPRKNESDTEDKENKPEDSSEDKP